MANIFFELIKNDWYLFTLFFVLILFLILLSEIALKKNIWSNHINRKIIHITIGIAVSITPFLFSINLYPTFLASIFFIINIISLKNNKLNSFHLIERESYGTIFFPLSYILISGFFWDYPYYITASFLILAIADPIASVIGSSKNKNIHYNILGDKKSLNGSIAMFICTIIILSMFSKEIFHEMNISYQIIAILYTGIAITISEGLSYKGSDNLSIPIMAFLFIELFNFLNRIDFIIIFLFFTILIILLLYLFYLKKHLSISGFIGSSIMGILLFGFGGNIFIYPIVIFFITSTMLSFIKKDDQKTQRINRTINQVYANGGVALFICVLNYFYNHNLIYPCFLASIAAANSDTWGTEIGKFSNKKPIDIISGFKLENGVSGGITMNGTIGSFFGAALIGFIGFYFSIDIKIVLLIIISGFLSSIFDSILGSSIQGRYISPDGSIITEKNIESFYLYTGSKKINNDIVNLYCTISGPLIFLSLYFIV